jgi:quercetin dioxygenase-like cupin family protein
MDGDWKIGRAGMRYRDLIPGRLDGHAIASHIRIPGGGPVPDYVHFHRVHFQMIYCYRGWVKVVYEDQGPPFVLEAGDCVLQPPRIRHRVLEASPGLEVIEVGCPAVHETHADPELQLPNGAHNPDRKFGTQTFLRHVARDAAWKPWRRPGFESRVLGLGAATGGVARAHVARAREPEGSGDLQHDAELMFLFVLQGSVTLTCQNRDPALMRAGSACVIPAGLTHSLGHASADLELLEVALPARFQTLPA